MAAYVVCCFFEHQRSTSPKHFGPHRGAVSFERHSIPQDNKSRVDGKTALVATNYTIKNIWSPMLLEDIFDEKQMKKIREQAATESTLKMLGIRTYQFFGLGQKPQLWDLIRKLCSDHELVIKNEKKSFLDNDRLNKLQFTENLPMDCYLNGSAFVGYGVADFAELANAAVSGKFGEFFLHPNIDNALYVYRGGTDKSKIVGLKVGDKFLIKK